MTQRYGGIFPVLSTRDYQFLTFLTENEPYRGFEEEPGISEMSKSDLLDKVNWFKEKARDQINNFRYTSHLEIEDREPFIESVRYSREILAKLTSISKKLER